MWAKGLAVGGGFDVEVHDPDVFPLSLQGPKSETLLSRLIAEPVEDIRFFRFIHTRIDNIDLVVARTGWSGQGGFELYLSEPAEGERLWDIVVAAGADLHLRSGCPNLIDRIETGLLSHGNDVTLANNPIESGLNRFFKMGKTADYLGKQALEKIVAEGTAQQFVRLVFSGDPIANPREYYPLSVSGTAELGQVTSVIYSPRLGHNVGLGYVPASATAVGTSVTLSLPSGTVSGNIADKDWHTEPTQ